MPPTEILIEQLHGTDWTTRCDAARLLGQSRDPRAADARDARQERAKRLLELLKSESVLTRAAAALTLPWYGEKRSLEPLSELTHDPDATVWKAAVWSKSALQKSISYRNQFGM